MKKEILQTIIERKKCEVAALKEITPINTLQKSPYFERECFSLSQRLTSQKQTGIIAEFKRKSPSKGWIAQQADALQITTQYAQQPIAGISILTDKTFFGGNNDDLLQVREQIKIPILRKDFIIDPYQLYEAKAIGADVILLIAAALDPAHVAQLTNTAKALGMEVLLELHNDQELSHINSEIDIVGINNRNLKTFEVDITTSQQLFDKLPTSVAKISESGISTVEKIQRLQQVGFDGFLIGEKFMKTNKPVETLKRFVQKIHHPLCK